MGVDMLTWPGDALMAKAKEGKVMKESNCFKSLGVGVSRSLSKNRKAKRGFYEGIF